MRDREKDRQKEREKRQIKSIRERWRKKKKKGQSEAKCLRQKKIIRISKEINLSASSMP